MPTFRNLATHANHNQSQFPEGSHHPWTASHRLTLIMVTAKIWRCGGMKILRGCDCLWVEALNFLVRRGGFGNLFFKKKVEGK